MPTVPYTLTRKSIKNINLRVKRDGCVMVSAPYHVKRSKIDEFVAKKQPWIQSVQQRLNSAQHVFLPNIKTVTSKMCYERFAPILEHTLALLGQKPVTLRIRTCTSRWGSCQPQKRVVMLNRYLYYAPMRLVEYVVLHECAHLLFPHHGESFHSLMRTYMPDYTIRRKALRQLPMIP